MAGNRLGPREKYVYFSENPTLAYIIETDQDLAVAGLGDGAAAPVVFDPANPPAGVTVTPAPKNFRARTVFAQSTTDGARKNLIAFNANANLYATTTSQAVPAIDTDSTFVTTGRRGEQLSF